MKTRADISEQSEVFTRYIINDLDSRLPALRRIVRRWENQQHMAKNEFIADAENYITDNPGFQAIEWVDDAYYVRWVVPLIGNEKAENLFLGFEKRRLKALEEAKSISTPTMSRPIKLVQGGTGLLVYFPIVIESEFNGFLLVVFNTEKWIDYVFRDDDHSDVTINFDVTVKIADEIIFETPNYSKNNDISWLSEHRENILGHSLVVSIKPNFHYFLNRANYTAELVLGVFIVFGLILAYLVHFLKIAAEASKQMQLSIAALDRESIERKRAEDKATQASEAKTKFLAAMSHEIRTPLNAVLGIVQLLESRELPDDVVKKLKIAHESGNFLLTLINQILDFARIESGSVEIYEEDFVVGELIANLFSMFKFEADKKHIQFDYSITGQGTMIVSGDYNHIKQILFNLIGNAIKFTKAGSVIVDVNVSVEADKRVDLSFSVSDTGPGISEEEMPLIFEEFKQSESGKKSTVGSGLGLSISKQLAEFMGGHISVISRLDQGSKFTFQTSVNASDSQPRVTLTKEMKADMRSLRIMVAEDNNINQLIIEEMLRNDGHSVKIFDNGSSAVAELENNVDQYDLVLMDIQMPVMNGVEATKVIRKFVPDPKKLPIIALTANAFKTQVEEYLSAGMQATLTKPVILADLRAMLVQFSRRQDRGSAKTSEIERNDPDSFQMQYFDETVFIALKNSISEKAMASILDKFHVSVSDLLDKIQSNDIETDEVSKIAHELSGLVSNLGLVDLARKAKEIQKAADLDEETFAQINSMKDVAHSSLQELEKYLEASKPKDASYGNL